MKNIISLLLISSTLLLFGNSCSSDSSSTEHEKGKYLCPMTCEEDKTYEKAGACPVCNMDLEKQKDIGNEQGRHVNHEDHDRK